MVCGHDYGRLTAGRVQVRIDMALGVGGVGWSAGGLCFNAGSLRSVLCSLVFLLSWTSSCLLAVAASGECVRVWMAVGPN